MVPSCSPTRSKGRAVRATWEMRDKVCWDSVLAKKFRTESGSQALNPRGKWKSACQQHVSTAPPLTTYPLPTECGKFLYIV